jgi:class 3 adenylate cyclase/tetratricopeptide (TPR) repeat protein
VGVGPTWVSYALAIMRTCPRCGEENPERARFCLNCGQALGTTDAPRRERKFATALFADLVGSTTLAEQEDPEVVQAVVGRAFDRLAEEIARYEGLLEKFMGDAILAVFGVPRAHEDDADRAVRAALEMQAVLSELNRGFAADGKPQLAMRIGVEAGEVLVDVERVSGPRDRMLTGDAMNTASRLQSAADPGRVIVGPAVYEATKEVIEYRELPRLDLKGKSESVPAWEALRIRAKQRGERPELGMQAKLVGRDEELAVLSQTFERVRSETRPALVTVVGPAGVGKSRLAREFEGYVEALSEYAYWRRGRCLAYGNTSYSALADAIKAQCEILEDDAADVVLKKIESAVDELFGDTLIVPQIGALVGAGEPGAFSREDLFDAWRRFFDRMAARYPLVLVFEDVHWADDGLLDFIEYMGDWSQGAILTVSLARPELFERRPTWGGGKRNAASIALDPLSTAESVAMLDDLLAGALPEELERLVAERSEGNPLFVEEIVRKLIDDGVLRSAGGGGWEITRPIDRVELPRSIQGLIAARLDGLPDDEKALLQDASVVGRVFWSGAVVALSGAGSAQVRDALGRLRVKELVLLNDPPSFSDELEFTFRHALIRDSAYDSLPKSLRAAKQVQVARWAEAKAGDRADEIAALIATHDLEALRYFDELGDVSAQRSVVELDAYRWARAAADRAAALWLPVEASRWNREALGLAEVIGVPAAERADIARALYDASIGTLTVEESVEAAQMALALFEDADDELKAGAAESWLIMPAFQQGRQDEALEHGRRAIARLEPFGETRELAATHRQLGQVHWRRGDSEAADEHLRRAERIAERIGARDIRAEAMQDLGVNLSQTGRPQEALDTMEEAFRLAKEVGERANLQRMYNNYASTLANVGDFARAYEVASEGVELGRRIGGVGWLGWMVGTLGEISLALGDLNEAERINGEALEFAIASHDETLIALRHPILAQIMLLQGRIDEADAALGRAHELLLEDEEPQGEIPRSWTEAMLASTRGREADALAHLRHGVELSERFNVDFAPQLELDLIRMLIARGQRDEAMAIRAVLELGWSQFTRAFADVADGLLESDAAAAMVPLRRAVDRFDALGAKIELARALIDLGRVERRAGLDPRPSFERARTVLMECDAQYFVPEAESELASLGGT